MCISGNCDPGYYRAILSPENANTSLLGDLLLGTDVCIPCDELCSQCTGPGHRIQPNSCQQCSRATQGSRCVAGNNHSGKYGRLQKKLSSFLRTAREQFANLPYLLFAEACREADYYIILHNALCSCQREPAS